MTEPIIINGVTFEPWHGGREIARRGETIIGDIIPDGMGQGGWVYRFELGLAKRALPHFAHSRSEAREMLAGPIT